MSSSGDVEDVFGLAGTTLEGRFVVARPIAEGGFGVVYRAEQAALDRPVALKVLKTPPRYDEAAKQLFLSSFATEAKTIARITHPNIVLVYDFGVSVMPSGERAAWMALEWLTGDTLDHELTRRRGRGGRTPTECLDALRPALSALAVVHVAGVAHRDLKPANIMLVPGPTGLTPKLLDFGIAKIMDADEAPGTGQTRTRSSQVAFSPGYASPEQISHGRSGPWTDVHAMGLIVTEMLTDRAPLEGEEVALIFQQIVDRVRPTPAKFGVTVGAWEGVLARALAVSPSDRYRDATELLQALEGSVAEATTTHAKFRHTAPGSSPAPSPGGGIHTLGAMSTLQAPTPDGIAPAPSHVTTSTPTSNDASAARPRGSSLGIYLAAGVLGVAGLAALGYRASSTHSDVVAAPAVSVPPTSTPTNPPVASTTAPPVSAPASASPVPVPSTAPAAVPVAPPRDAPRRPPASVPSRPSASPPTAASAKATPNGKLILE